MEEINKTVYKCEYCGKIYQRKHFCINHEKQCIKNLDNFRICNGCRFLSKIETSLYIDTYMGEMERKVNVLFCSKLDCFVFPPKVEHKGNAFDFGDKENIPMKKECEFYIWEHNEDI
jgi:hypothetical protein